MLIPYGLMNALPVKYPAVYSTQGFILVKLSQRRDPVSAK